MGRLLTGTLPDPDGAGPLAAPVKADTYTADGRLQSVEDFAGQLLSYVDNAAGLLNQYQYDDLNRITRITQAGQSGGNAVAEKRVDFEYDLVFKKFKNRFAEITRYADLAGSETVAVSSYAYDFAGRLTGIEHRDSASVLLAGYSLSHDEGNRLTKTNNATGETVEYSWDHRNRLTAIVTKDDLGVITHEVQYTYDIFDRRIVKTIDADGAGPGNPTQESYIYDGLREERGSAGDHILLRFDDSENVTGRYLHGPDVDQILAGEKVTGLTVEGHVLWALTDHLGSVHDLAEYDAVSGDTSIVNHIVYDAFGRIVSETDAAFDFLYGFTGRERDTESDLQYNRARYYDAATGRWLNQDPIGFDAGDVNLYRHVGNQPTTKTDPLWLEPPAKQNILTIPWEDLSSELQERFRESGYVYVGGGVGQLSSHLGLNGMSIRQDVIRKNGNPLMNVYIFSDSAGKELWGLRVKTRAGQDCGWQFWDDPNQLRNEISLQQALTIGGQGIQQWSAFSLGLFGGPTSIPNRPPSDVTRCLRENAYFTPEFPVL